MVMMMVVVMVMMMVVVMVMMMVVVMVTMIVDRSRRQVAMSGSRLSGWMFHLAQRLRVQR